MPLRFPARTALIVALLSTGGCDFVRRYTSASPADRLVETAVAGWAAPGSTFLGGVAGRDTVASVSATGARSWEVAVVPPSGGVPAVWSLEIPRVDVYPAFPGDAFAPWLQERARELGLRTFLPADVVAQLRAGGIRGVGDLEVRYGPADRSGRNTEQRIAFLVPVAGEAAEWRMQPESRSAQVLLEALQRVGEDMLHRDDRVLSCMGSASPASVPRDVQLECLTEVLSAQFGET